MRILNAEPDSYSQEAKKVLEKLGTLIEKSLSQEELVEQIKGIDVLIVRLGLQIDREVIEAGDQLKYIVSATTGTDHIDLGFAEARGIRVLCLKGEHQFLRSIPSTAEHTWALLLSLIRKVPWAFNHVCEYGWDRDQYRGFNLSGKKLGIIGLGRVGRQVATFSKAFQLQTGAYDPIATQWTEDVIRFSSIEKIMKWSNIVSIHVPYHKETEKMINERLLSLLPKGAFIINTSRSGVWDESAVLNLLQSEHLAGVATDVICDEQYQQKRVANPLIQYANTHKNLLITPHIAGATTESMMMTELFMANKLARISTEENKRIKSNKQN